MDTKCPKTRPLEEEVDTAQKTLHLCGLIDFLVLLYPQWPTTSDTTLLNTDGPKFHLLGTSPSVWPIVFLQSTICKLQVSYLKDGWKEFGLHIRVTLWTLPSRAVSWERPMDIVTWAALHSFTSQNRRAKRVPVSPGPILPWFCCHLSPRSWKASFEVRTAGIQHEEIHQENWIRED